MRTIADMNDLLIAANRKGERLSHRSYPLIRDLFGIAGWEPTSGRKPSLSSLTS